MSECAYLVKARKRHYCENYPRTQEGCLTFIEPGEDYVRAVTFPGDVTDHIWVMRLCVPCAQRYGRPLPPRRSTTPSRAGDTR